MTARFVCLAPDRVHTDTKMLFYGVMIFFLYQPLFCHLQKAVSELMLSILTVNGSYRTLYITFFLTVITINGQVINLK